MRIENYPATYTDGLAFMLQAVRVFLMVRELSLTVRREPERQLPLSRVEYSVQENEVLDLSMLKIYSSVLHARQSSSMVRNCGGPI